MGVTRWIRHKVAIIATSAMAIMAAGDADAAPKTGKAPVQQKAKQAKPPQDALRSQVDAFNAMIEGDMKAGKGSFTQMCEKQAKTLESMFTVVGKETLHRSTKAYTDDSVAKTLEQAVKPNADIIRIFDKFNVTKGKDGARRVETVAVLADEMLKRSSAAVGATEILARNWSHVVNDGIQFNGKPLTSNMVMELRQRLATDVLLSGTALAAYYMDKAVGEQAIGDTNAFRVATDAACLHRDRTVQALNSVSGVKYPEDLRKRFAAVSAFCDNPEKFVTPDATAPKVAPSPPSTPPPAPKDQDIKPGKQRPRFPQTGVITQRYT